MDVKDHIWVAIIAGGQGTRLFPISHSGCPKQFCRLNEESFLQATIKNYTSLGVKPTRIVITVTNDNQKRLALEQALSCGVLSQNVYQLDLDYGYAGSMIKAAEFIHQFDRDAIIINTPSDHFLSPSKYFSEAISRAISEAQRGFPVIVGVKINDIVTATGCGHALYEESDSACFPVTGFIEKPDLEEADRIMRQGNSACNTGINIWKAGYILRKVKPADVFGLNTDELMAKLADLRIAVGTFEWYDCGTLKSLYDISKKSPYHKNVCIGGGTFEQTNCRRSLLYAAEGMELRVTGATDDAVIFTMISDRPIIVVAKLEESQRIKSLAEEYSKCEAILTEDFSFGARNNTVLGSNISDKIIVGFVGVTNYAVYVYEKEDGNLEAVVSQQLNR